MSSNEPTLRDQHASDKYGTKLVEKVGDLQSKAAGLRHKDSSETKEPAGGFDSTPLPHVAPGYTIRITFHRAEKLPISDFPTLSADPYIHATFKTNLTKRHKQDPDLYLRTPTIHRNTEPQWNTQWVIAHVPASGFFLKCRIYDEDPSDHDDRLGNVHIYASGISEQWQGFKEQSYELKKRMGSKRAYTVRGVMSLFSRKVDMDSARLIVSVECLGRSPGDSGGRCYTVAPLPWSRHHSPLIGRLVGTKDEGEKDGKKTEKYNFQAVQMQLRGPVPDAMYHRYVEFKPFVAGMFTDVTLRGRILNRALHHQHARVYNYDGTTIYGIFEKPSPEMTRQFLEFCHYDQGGRIYTYVLSLDGKLSFTETGKEFGIDMLSKHTMHSDVSIYIAFSGEFFIRRLKHPHGKQHDNQEGDTTDIAPAADDNEADDHAHSLHHHDDIPKDPAYYELIIDNDSGTYRPNAKILPLLKEYMKQNFPGLRVATLDCQGDEERMKRLKEEQRDRKKHSGKQITYMQNNSASSLSSSDEEELEARAAGVPRQHGYKKQLKKMHMWNGDGEEKRPDTAHSRDSRDIESSISDLASVNGHSQDSGYGDKPQALKDQAGYKTEDLPGLLSHANGGERKQTNGTDVKVGEPEFGDHQPQGGMVYDQAVELAAVDQASREKSKGEGSK